MPYLPCRYLILRGFNKLQIQLNKVMSEKRRTSFHWNEERELAFQEALVHMDATIDSLFPLLSKAEIKEIAKSEKHGSIKVVRFSKEDSLHVVVMKLAQLTSNLRAGRLLIDHGFVYEFGVMCRLLQEAVEDIFFFVYENRVGKESSLHEKFRRTFYTEDVDEAGNWQQPSNWVGRKKIREFVDGCLTEDTSKVLGTKADPLDETMKGLYGFGSGYVHGRVSKAMRLHDLEENKFLTNGLYDEEYLSIELKRFWVIVIKAVGCCDSIAERCGAPKEYLSNIRMFLESLKKIAGLGD